MPAGVTAVRVLAQGGAGGAAGDQFTGTGGTGGLGGVVQQTYPVTAGTDISMVVGCLGASGSASPNDAATPGWSKGGGAGIGSTSIFEGGASGGAGGGATGVCIGSATCKPGDASVRLVGGGGGGGGVTNCSVIDSANSRGGRGGWLGTSPTSGGGGIGNSGEDGASSNGAGGAGGVNSTAGAADGAASVDGSGGASVNVVGGGAGGGYRGGKAGAGAATGCVGGGGGGGGSSWVHGTELGYTGGHCSACVPEQGKVEITLLRPVTTELTSSKNPSRAGERVALTARVYDDAGPYTFTRVEFFRDGVSFGSESTDRSGVASMSMLFPSSGSFTIEAKPQTSFADGPTSASLVQQVEDGEAPAPAATRTTVTSSANPSVLGDEVTFTVLVQPASEGSFAHLPTGTVEMYDGTTLLGSARTTDPQTWVFATSSLPEGDREITARYLGDERFLPSEAALLQQVGASTPPTSDPSGSGPTTTEPTDPSGSGPTTTEPTDPSGSGPTTVKPTDPNKPGSTSTTTTTSRASVRKPSGLRLPRTGTEVMGLAAAGFTAVAAGGLLLVVRKRRSDTAP